MGTLRIHNGAFIIPPMLRVHNAVLQGTSNALTLRIHNGALQGTALVPVSLQPMADATVEPFDTVVLTPTPQVGSATPDGYQWRQVSGPAVTALDNGTSLSFTAPAVLAGGLTPIIFGVFGVKGASVSPEVQVTRFVYPNTAWRLDSDHVWRPRRNRVRL